MRWRRWLFTDWRLKLVGVVGAAVLWYMISGRTVELTVGVPVTVAVPPGRLVLTRVIPDEVKVRFSVRQSLVPDLKSVTVRAVAEVSRAGFRRLAVELGPENVICPAGAKVLDVRPALVIVEMETSVQGR
jgi:hypothetical protein